MWCMVHMCLPVGRHVLSKQQAGVTISRFAVCVCYVFLPFPLRMRVLVSRARFVVPSCAPESEAIAIAPWR